MGESFVSVSPGCAVSRFEPLNPPRSASNELRRELAAARRDDPSIPVLCPRSVPSQRGSGSCEGSLVFWGIPIPPQTGNAEPIAFLGMGMLRVCVWNKGQQRLCAFGLCN